MLIAWDPLPDGLVLAKVQMSLWERSKNKQDSPLVVYFLSSSLRVLIQDQEELHKLVVLSPNGWLEEAVTLRTGQRLPAGSRTTDEKLSELKDLPTLMRFSTPQIQWGGHLGQLRRKYKVLVPDVNTYLLREVASTFSLGHLAQRKARGWVASMWKSAEESAAQARLRSTEQVIVKRGKAVLLLAHGPSWNVVECCFALGFVVDRDAPKLNVC
eukprot:3311613-Amphidinium_carterae.1